VKTLPNFLIIGASKSGTSTLAALLQQHPQVFLSAVKEPHYFCFKGSGLPRNGPGDTRRLARVTETWNAYHGLFREAEGYKAVGEASTNYLYDPLVAQHIKKVLPDVRLICLLRQPAERAYSAYKHLRRDGDETESTFKAALGREAERKARGFDYLWRYAECGFYGRHLKAYLEIFPREQIRVLRFEDLIIDPRGLVNELEVFLGLKEFRGRITPVHENAASGLYGEGMTERFSLGLSGRIWRLTVPLRWRLRVRKWRRRRNSMFPPLASDLASEMMEGYREDIRLLEALTGLDTGTWKS
jgi:hypothetical protein